MPVHSNTCGAYGQQYSICFYPFVFDARVGLAFAGMPVTDISILLGVRTVCFMREEGGERRRERGRKREGEEERRRGRE